MKILVFGKDGQLGRAFADLLSNVPISVEVNYLGRQECDLSNQVAILDSLDRLKPDLIINASAYTAVDKAEQEVDLAYAINAKAPELMAAYARDKGIAFIHYSTDYVFDGSKEGAYTESDARSPLGMYGKSKAAGEEAIERVFVNSSMGQFAIFRTSWVYGEGGNFIRTMLRLAKERDGLKVIHDQYGVPTSAAWLAQVSLSLVLDPQFNLRRFASGVYHAVPGGETTWYGLACFAVQTAKDKGVDLRADPGAIRPILAMDYPLPAPRPMNSRMDSTKLRLALSNGSATHSSFYNDSDHTANALAFPQWDDMVYEYVSKLISNGLV
jgi:dTDP-4-dehydrorhamnose reductase